MISLENVLLFPWCFWFFVRFVAVVFCLTSPFWVGLLQFLSGKAALSVLNWLWLLALVISHRCQWPSVFLAWLLTPLGSQAPFSRDLDLAGTADLQEWSVVSARIRGQGGGRAPPLHLPLLLSVEIWPFSACKAVDTKVLYSPFTGVQEKYGSGFKGPPTLVEFELASAPSEVCVPALFSAFLLFLCFTSTSQVQLLNRRLNSECVPPCMCQCLWVWCVLFLFIFYGTVVFCRFMRRTGHAVGIMRFSEDKCEPVYGV